MKTQLQTLAKDPISMNLLKNGTAGNALLAKAVYATILFLLADKPTKEGS